MNSAVEGLDIRLRRLEYAFTGAAASTDGVNKSNTKGVNIPSEIASLNERLAKLANQNKSIKRLLEACLF